MRITPLDVRKQEFRKVVRGLDAEEVYAFLATVAEEYETVLTDNKQLREQVVNLDEKVSEFRNMEKTLRDTLMTAERVTGETRQNAEKEAQLIVERARISADKETASIAARVEGLKNQLRELRQQRDAYLTRLRTLSESQLNLLDNYKTDFDRDDAAIHGASAPPATTQGPPSAPQPAPQPTPQPTQMATPPDATAPAAGPRTPAPGDDWRNYAVGAGSAVAPSQPEPPVDTRIDPIPSAAQVARAVDEANAEATAPGGQSPESVATSPDPGATPESGRPETVGVGASGEGTTDSGWSVSRFTQGLGEI